MPLTRDQAKNALLETGYIIENEERLPNDSGWKLTLGAGQIVNAYDSGKCHVGGKNPDEVQCLLDAATGKSAGRKVFVVYGHDETALLQLEAMLRRWDLEPLILRNLTSGPSTWARRARSSACRWRRCRRAGCRCSRSW